MIVLSGAYVTKNAKNWRRCLRKYQVSRFDLGVNDILCDASFVCGHLNLTTSLCQNTIWSNQLSDVFYEPLLIIAEGFVVHI